MNKSAVTKLGENGDQQVLSKMQAVCTENYNRMEQLWSTMFDRQICGDYMNRLPDHMMAFFDEVYDESYQRKRRIEEEIIKLRKESHDLRRLLNEQPDPVLHLDAGENEKLPLLTLQTKLDNSLEQMRARLRERLVVIDDYILEAETLCEELGEEPRLLQKDPLPTEQELTAYRSYIDGLIAEKLERLGEITTLRREIKAYMADLEIQPQTEHEQLLLNARNFPPTNRHMQGLRELRDDTANQYRELQRLIDEKHVQLARMWEHLDIDPAIVRKFQKITKYTQSNFDKLYAEYNRCETLRRENMKTIVERTRSEIAEWWDRCLKSEDERARFTTFRTHIYNEDTLTLHEMELEDLKEYYRTNEHIFKLIAERQEMWDRMLALESKSSDPSRYNNRGGKLLEEEKERRRIGTKLPKVEQKLREACFEYESKNGRPFMIYGRSLQETMQEQWQRREDTKQQISSARKKANGIVGGLGTPGRFGGADTLMLTRTGGGGCSATVSLLSANRSRMMGSSRKVPVTPLASASKQGTAGSLMKRKLATTPTNMMHAKRSLLRQLNSPALSATNRSNSKTLVPKAAGGAPARKLPVVKVYDTKVAGSVVQKRRSLRKSQGKRRSGVHRQQQQHTLPSLVISSAEGTMLQDSVCYENFENFLGNNVPNRSSVVAAVHRNKHTNGQPPAAGVAACDDLGLANLSEEEENQDPVASSTAHGISITRSQRNVLQNSISTRTRNASMRLMPAPKNCPTTF
ncbi:protein regulator of cytokinesis 1-like [Anopheles albimanus]|uniref:Protein regulator of cytokinesis 1 prc1 n=1 Tax=Anopheles albimanus TaxID=7167 RepID=A0A182FKM9_ANOAL|nr:protein regulator of cytokinesis 1-like [Anopheles albimanus]